MITRHRFPIAIGLALVCAIFALATLFSHSANAGELPPTEEKIVYSCSFDFVLDICSMNPDGTGEVMLTDDAGFDEHPEVSPGGQMIAWEKNLSEIWVMNADGSNDHLVIGAFVHAPTWSPDGNMLAFACAVGGEIGICTANAAGSTAPTLVATLQGASQPDWSPDGTKIIFQAQEIGQNAPDIYVVTLASGEIVNLTNTTDRSESFPRWSPDGTKFAFWGSAPSGDPAAAAIHTANANGSSREELRTKALFSSPAWSPDGTQIAFVCTELPGQGRQMCIVDSQDGDLIDVLEVTAGHQTEIWADPSWATSGGGSSGDADCNGVPSARDNQALLRFILQQPPLSQTEPCPDIGDEVTIGGQPHIWGDWDCSGVITVRDAQSLLRFLLEQPPLSQTEPCADVGSRIDGLSG